MSMLITGGSRGLGRSMVQVALTQGRDVAFTYVRNRDAAEAVLAWAQEHTPDRRCVAYQLDVSSSEQVDAVGDQILDDFLDLKALVCNAGVNRDNLLISMTDEAWREVIDTNLAGPFYLCRKFLPEFLAQRYGRIVLIGSIAEHGVTGQANYAASKSGLAGLAKTVGKEYGRKGITANVVSPGFFHTDMTRQTMPQHTVDHWNALCPIGRFGRVEELASTVMYLTSKEASFLNAQVISVTGGLDWSA